jgi:hypothetical protein
MMGMRYLKIALTFLALLVAAAATAMTAGLFNVPPTVIGIATTAAIALGYFGIQPLVISEFVNRAISGVALFLGAVVAWHASVVSTLANPHPWIWQLVGVVAILAGVIGKSPINHVAIGSPAALDGPPPAAKT